MNFSRISPFIAGKRKIILIVLVLLILISVYFNFFYAKKCKTEDCFNIAMARCKKSTFVNDQGDLSWFYRIEGRSRGNCGVYVKNIDIAFREEALRIKGKDMLCSIPLGVVTAPENNLDMCHGLLKEEIQDMLIERLHLYIVQNIGQIKEELIKPL